MTRFRFLASAAILSFSLGACTFAYSQDNHDKRKDMDRRQNQDKHAGAGNQPQKQMERSPDQEHDQRKMQERAWQERRANHWQYERRSWQQRGGYNGYRVPDDYFRDHYGDSHAFRIYGLPFLYEAGNPRFQYGGHWFTMLDPFPENWDGRWYETDDVYVAYQGDGYYLFNRSHPGPLGIALSVSL